MKKSLIILSTILLTACSGSSYANTKGDSRFEEIEEYDNSGYYITIIKDKNTRCKYMKTTTKYADGVSVTPLYIGNGQVDCN
ncbi:hypothetical protein CN566_28380 [Bacillus wiedmannii]|uniref:hypothetical protein n=1 Tax=Bacillus wiedmannii TaxID=1890302 RepID=UPI000BF5D12E|nr:hypothetical protein [Bacillus wiedmannii]PEP21722.1 hypothetical protein CN566_28380 [Bacillus wiedmannii]